MGIVLNVLIFIGIILLVIFCITLLLIVIVLLSPIHYQAEARGDTKDGSVVADLKVTWLGLAFGFFGHYDRLSGKPPSRSVRILGIDPFELYRKWKEKKRKWARAAKKRRLEKLKRTNPEEYNRLKEEARRRKNGEAAAADGSASSSDTAGTGDGTTGITSILTGPEDNASSKQSGPGNTAADKDEAVNNTAADKDEAVNNTAADVDDPNFDEADWDDPYYDYDIPFISWFMELILKIISKIQRACGTIGTWNEYRKDPSTREAIHILIYRSIKILKHSFPDISGRLAFGFTDPSITGELLALASMFYPLWAEKLVLQPDFNEFLLNGEVHISGRIRPGTVGWHALMTILRKEVRETIKIFRSR